MATPKRNVRAWILLGINAGFGQNDVSELPFAALKRKGWVIFPRPKTGIDRACPLWPETIEALKESCEYRYKPENEADADIVFVSKFKRRLIRFRAATKDSAGYHTDGIGQEYRKFCNLLEVPTGFYRLRHTFRTVAGGSKDAEACNYIMGHAATSMAGNYTHGIDDARLVAVTEHVRKWLFG